jgi:hypothetical protein
MKRSRSVCTDEYQQAERRAKHTTTVGNISVSQEDTGNCFFFVKLLNGASITVGEWRVLETTHYSSRLLCAVWDVSLLLPCSPCTVHQPQEPTR